MPAWIQETPMKDVRLRDDGERWNARACVERIVLAAWIVTAIGAVATVLVGHYFGAP